jgi:predicted PurR-regulated permease PerM
VNEDRFFPLKVIQTVLIILFFALLSFVVFQVRDMLMLAFLSIILSLFIRSISDVFQKRFKFKKWLALTIGVISLILLMVIPFATISVPFVDQAKNLLKDMPGYIKKLEFFVNQLSVRFTFLQNINLDSIYSRFSANTESIFSNSISYIGLVTNSIVNFILMLALAAFFASNPGEYNELVLRFVPSNKRILILETIHEMETILKHWLVGTLLAIIFVAALATFGLSVIGLKYSLVFGIAAGFMEIIPYFGPTLGIIAPALYALAAQQKLVIPILIIFLLIQFAENYFFIPFVMRKQVNLPPAVSILAIMIFGKLLGFLGVVVGLPLFTIILLVLEKVLNQQSGKTSRKRVVESELET